MATIKRTADIERMDGVIVTGDAAFFPERRANTTAPGSGSTARGKKSEAARPTCSSCRENLTRARTSGKTLRGPKGSLGTSRLDGRENEVLKLLDLGISKSAVAKMTGISRPTLYNFLNSRVTQTSGHPDKTGNVPVNRFIE